jgi:hypothetical protein
MNALVAFAIDLVSTLLIGLLLMLYLRPSLHRVLVDLCGGEDRARFWSDFSSVVLIGVPAAAALGYNPYNDGIPSTFLNITRQLGQNLMSFLVALMGLGLVVAFFALVAPRAAREQHS